VEFYNNLSQQPGCQYNCANTQWKTSTLNTQF
jgi:hypothetical protein